MDARDTTNAGRDRDPIDALAESFIERYRRGERPEIAEYIERCPEHADRIRELFPTLLMVERLGSAEARDAGTRAGRAEAKAVREIGDYTIVRTIGSGGMGVVYEAQQESLGRRVALKVLPSQALLNEGHLERFRREAQAAARLHHTNIVPVYDVGEEEGLHYYAMQLIHGQSLDKVIEELRQLKEEEEERGESSDTERSGGGIAARLRSGELRLGAEDESARDAGPSPPAEAVDFNSGAAAAAGTPPEAAGTGGAKKGGGSSGASSSRSLAESDSTLGTGSSLRYFQGVARLGMQAADALAYAHGEGVLHRDIKPSNLLLDTKGSVWITDFGLAKTEDSDTLTRSGDVVGTLSYMAPERFDGWSDPRSDVYGLGLTLYELLTLRRAFDDPDRRCLMRKVAEEIPPAPRAIDPRIPRDLETIILKAIEKEPSHRYAAAAQMEADLRRFVEGRPIEARRAGAAERVRLWCRRNPAVASLTALLLSILAAGTIVASVLYVRAEDRALQAGEYARQAGDNAALAIERAEEAERNRGLAQEAERRHRRLLYFSDMNSAQHAWRAGDARRVERLLARHVPAPGDEDLRGFEWFSLWRESHGYRKALEHGGAVCGVEFLPGGGTLATASFDGKVRLWDAGTGKVTAEIVLPIRPEGIALFPGGKMLACAAGTPGAGFVMLCNLETGELAGTLEGYPVRIEAVACSPDGALIAAAGSYFGVTIWDVASRSVKKTIPRGSVVRSLAFSPDGARLAIGSDTTVLWDLAADAARGEIRDGLGEAAAFSPDGTLLACGASLCDAATGGVRMRLKGSYGAVSAARFAPNGRVLATGHDDGTVRLWEVTTCELLAVLRGHSSAIAGVSFSPDGTVLATAGDDYSVKLWSMAAPSSPETFRAAPPGYRIRSMALSSDSTRAVCAYSNPATHDLGMAKVWNIRTGEEKAEFGRTIRGVPDASFSPDGAAVASTNGSGTIFWWNADTAELKYGRRRGGGWNGQAPALYSPDGKTIATGTGDPGVELWDPASGLCVGSFEHSHVVTSLAFSPDGAVLVSGSNDVELWDMKTGEKLDAFEMGATVRAVAFSPDGRTLAAGSEDGIVEIRDAGTRAATHVMKGHIEAVRSLSFSPDGRILASSSEEHSIKLWDVETGALRTTLRGGNYNFGVFSGDGEFLASEGVIEEGGRTYPAIKLWRAASEKEVRQGFLDEQPNPDCFWSERFLAAWHRKRAAHCAAEEEWPAALVHINCALGLAGEDRRLYAERAWARAVLGEWEEAARDHAKAIELRPGSSSVEPFQELGRDGDKAVSLAAGILYRTGRTREAVLALERRLPSAAADSALRGQIDGYRHGLFPDLVSCASIDWALAGAPSASPASSGTIIAKGATWRFFRGKKNAPSAGLAWTAPGFDDSSWETGESGFGYGDNDDEKLIADMQGAYTTLYIRRAFRVDDPRRCSGLRLSIRIDDGCIAYLNGKEAARVNAGAPGAEKGFRAFADSVFDEARLHTFPVDPALLVPGENVLAIQGLNANLESSDFSLIPVLEGTIEGGPRAERNDMIENFRRSAAASDPRLSYLEGRELALKGRHRDAAEKFMGAIRADATLIEPYRRLAASLSAAGDPAYAETALREAFSGPLPRDDAFFEEWMGLCVRTLRWEPEKILSALPRDQGGARVELAGRMQEVVRGLEFLKERGLAEGAVLEFEEGEDTPLIRTVLWSDGMYVPAVAGPEDDARWSILGGGGDGPYFRVTHPGLEGAADLRIRCVFYDDPAFGARPVPVTLQYTARSSNGPEDSPRVLRRHPSQAQLSGSGRWVSHAWYLRDAGFRSLMQGGADFRIRFAARVERVALDRIEVAAIDAETLAILDRLDAVSAEHPLPARAIEALRADPSLDEGARARAVEIARDYLTASALSLNNESWEIARERGRPPEEYRRAVRLAEAACELTPGFATYLNTLGVAQYRAGLYKEALATLVRADEANCNAELRHPRPTDLLFIALCHQRLGESDRAREVLAEARKERESWVEPGNELGPFLEEAVREIDPPAAPPGPPAGADAPRAE